MNSKKAKALRREAEMLTIGMPMVDYMPYQPVTYFKDPQTNRKMKRKDPAILKKEREQSRRYYRKNLIKEKIRKQEWWKKQGKYRRLEYNLKYKHNMSLKDYRRMVKDQDNRCFICNSKSFKERLSVDHCHKTGKIRHLLCRRCNAMLGMVSDNIKILEKTIEYLKESVYATTKE